MNANPKKADWPQECTGGAKRRHSPEGRASLGSINARQAIGLSTIRLDLPGLGTIHLGVDRGVVAPTFLSAGTRDLPVPCSRAGRFPARFSAGRNWRLESRQHPPTRKSAPQPTIATNGGAFGGWRLPIANLMAFFGHAPILALPIRIPSWVQMVHCSKKPSKTPTTMLMFNDLMLVLHVDIV